MRTLTRILHLSLCCSCSVFGQTVSKLVAEDTLTTATSINTDSISAAAEWQVRAPLSEEQQQKRRENRAEVEDMKRRFREFHQSEAPEKSSTEDANYLWGEPNALKKEEDHQKAPLESVTTSETEALRMEIGRNLQEGKQAVVPDAPVLPNYPSTVDTPRSYDTKGIPNPHYTQPTPHEDWQATLKTALQAPATSANDDQWRNQLGQADASESSSLILVVGQINQLNQVTFLDSQSSRLAATSFPELDSWIQRLRQNAGLRISLRVHVNGGASHSQALELSNQRALAIVAYWKQRGVQEHQVIFSGYGNNFPLVPADNALAQQKNERIELIILEMP